MRKLSGWQKAGLIAGVGCFSILGVLVIGLVVAVVWARSTIADLGDTTPATVERTIPVASAVHASPGSHLHRQHPPHHPRADWPSAPCKIGRTVPKWC